LLFQPYKVLSSIQIFYNARKNLTETAMKIEVYTHIEREREREREREQAHTVRGIEFTRSFGQKLECFK
jgi:hypothetical protein